MSFLLDTNAISELVRPGGDRRVIDWIDRHEPLLFVSIATFAEIRRGIELLGDGRRRNLLTEWIDDTVPRRFGGRILDIDRRVAYAWGTLMVRSERQGRRLDVIDGFIVATAAAHGLTLVTRNTRHFVGLDIPLFDPWTDAS